MTTPRPQLLAGKEVLIVEDRYLIATEIADEVHRLGGSVVGPARNLAEAADLAASSEIRLALLDVNLDGEMVFPLAEALADRGVPMIFLTGYDTDVLPPSWRDCPVLAKPFDVRQLCRELVAMDLH